MENNLVRMLRHVLTLITDHSLDDGTAGIEDKMLQSRTANNSIRERMGEKSTVLPLTAARICQRWESNVRRK